MGQSLKEKTVKGVVWSSINRFSSQGISFVFSMLIARMLMPFWRAYNDWMLTEIKNNGGYKHVELQKTVMDKHAYRLNYITIESNLETN